MGITASEALERLRDGNRCFVQHVTAGSVPRPEDHPSETAGGQEPFAIVLGCSDSRVPLETVFDQGLGDLFVIRVAGNVVNPEIVGSVEFAATAFGTRLVVVLGHSNCGAVDATLQEVGSPGTFRSPNLMAILDRIRTAVDPLLAERELDDEGLFAAAVRANVLASAAQLGTDSDVLAGLSQDDGLRIIGAEYDLGTGSVEFFDE